MAMSRGKMIAIAIPIGIVFGAIIGFVGAVFELPMAVRGGVVGATLAAMFVILQRKWKAEAAAGPSDSASR